MPELPEVETTRRGVAPYLEGQAVIGLIVREPRLRWSVPDDLAGHLCGQVIRAVERRAKFLLFRTDRGTLIIHLGMSGSLRIIVGDIPVRKHDHIDMLFEKHRLRYHDPRRFGGWLWWSGDPMNHPRLSGLGPEPLAPGFSGDYLNQAARGRTVAVKNFIMDGRIVVGIGNIYANEALFRAGIHPQCPAGAITVADYRILAEAIRNVLTDAIERGGTTLRDFVNEAGRPGYFQQSLCVYDREGKPCRRCKTAIVRLRVGQRASFCCPRCQPCF